MAREPNHFVYEDDEFGTEGIEIIPPPEDPVAELDAEIARVDAILKAAGEPVDVADAVLPLYISRKVLNAEEVLTWAREQGFENLLDADELHVTQAYSRQPLEWFDVDQSWEEKLEIGAGGPRSIEMFGSAVVLRFASRSLQWRFEELQKLGASWDYAEYKPHVTLSYAGSIPPGAVPYQGRLELGPEIFEEVDDPSFFADSEQPRHPAGSPIGGQFAAKDKADDGSWAADGKFSIETKTGDKFILVTEAPTDSFKHVSIVAKTPEGKRAGKFDYTPAKNRFMWSGVEPEFRRKGLATAVYDFVESKSGRKLKPNEGALTEAGEALWTNRRGQKND